jgi:hypothetical protein
MSDLTARLEQLGLTAIEPDADNPQARWAFEAAGSLSRPDGVAIDNVRMGLGMAPGAVPVDAAGISAEQVAAISDANAVWAASGYDVLTSGATPTQPVWLVVLTASGAELSAAVPLPLRTNGASPLEAPEHFTFVDPLVLRVHMRIAGSVIQSLEAHLEGSLAVIADVGPIQLDSGPGDSLVGKFTLALEAFEGRNLSNVLANPTSLLESEFRGVLTAAFTTTQPVGMLGFQFTGTQTIQLSVQVDSAPDSRLLTIGSLTYDHQLVGSLSFGGAVGVNITAANFRAELPSWSPAPGTFILKGVGDIQLPSRLHSVAEAGSTVSGEINLHYEPSPGTLDVDLGVEGLRLATGVNPLGMTTANLRVALHRTSANVWSLAISGAAGVSWGQLAQNLRDARIVSLPSFNGMPDALASFRLELGETTTTIFLRLALVDPDDRTSPRGEYVGTLGPMPIRISGAVLVLTGTGSGVKWLWTASGQARITTIRELADIVPLAELPATFSLSAGRSPNEPPELLIEIGSGLLPLRLPALRPGGAPLDVVRLTRLAMQLGSDISVEAEAELLGNLNAATLGLPAQWDPIAQPLITWVNGSTGTVKFTLPLQREGAARIEVKFDPSPEALDPDTEAFDFFGALAMIAPGAPAQGSGATNTMQLSTPLFTMRPRERDLENSDSPATLTFLAELPSSGEPTLSVAVRADCTVLDETFDVTLRFSYRGGQPELSLLAGTINPIRISIPAPPAVPKDLDQQIDRIIADYRILPQSPGADALRAAASGLRRMFGAADAKELMAFEIVNLGVTVRLAAGEDPLILTGGVRIAKFPPIFATIFEGPSPTVTLGSSGTSVFIELTPFAPPDGQPPAPLVRIPVSEQDSISVVLHALRIGYGWAPPAFELSLNADVAVPDHDFDGGIGLLLPEGTSPNASASMEIEVKAVPGSPPLLEWKMDFSPQNSDPSSRGLELVLGAARDNRLITVYLRKTGFNPAYFLLMPALNVDCGVIFESPINSGFLEVVIGNATLVFINPVIGLMMNPLAAVPPFLTATPPFWVIPGLLMGDLFTDNTTERGFKLRANIPDIIEFDLKFRRPLPTFTLPMLFEIAALAAQGFTVLLPPNSALKNLFFARLEGSIRIPVLEILFGQGSGSLSASIEFNLVEIINGALRLLNDVRKLLQDSAQALADAQEYVTKLISNPEVALRMIPPAQRRISARSHLGVLNLNLDISFSAFLLLPEEVEAELKIFHENQRKVGKGLGALKSAPSGSEPSGPEVEKKLVETVKILRNFQTLGDPLSYLSPFTVDLMRLNAFNESRKTIEEQLAAARQDLLEVYVGSLAESLIQLSQAERDRLARQHRLDDVLRELESVFIDPRKDRDKLIREISSIISGPLSKAPNLTVTLWRKLDASPAVIARRLANAIVKPAKGAQPGQRFQLEVLKDRGKLYRDQIAGVGIGGGGFASDLDDAVGNVVVPSEGTLQDLTNVRGQLAAEVEAAIHGNLTVVSRTDQTVSDLLATIARSLSANFSAINTTANPGNGAAKVMVFDGVLARENWDNLLPGRVKEEPPQPGTPITEEAKGFEIAINSRDAHLAPDWSEPVQGPNSGFRVEFREGKYWLITLGADGEDVREELPAPLVGAVPPGPARARTLAGMLILRKRMVRRVLTAKEVSYATEKFETIPALYQKSIFYLPEFEIRSEGGKRGATYVADLLRQPDGTYIVPNGITAMAGCMVRVLVKSGAWGGLKSDFRVQLCGLASTDGHVLLFGHASQTLDFGTMQFVLRGDFHIAAGDFATVAIDKGRTIEPDSMGFHGFAQVKRGSSDLMRAEASGSVVRVAGGYTELQLHVLTHVAFQHEIAAGGVKLVKAWLDADVDFDLTIGEKFTASTKIDLTLKYAFGEFETEKLKAEVSVCAGGVCTPKVGLEVDVPNPTKTMKWGPTKTFAGSLEVKFDSGANEVLTIVATGKVPLPDGGKHNLSLKLPDFVNAVL